MFILLCELVLLLAHVPLKFYVIYLLYSTHYGVHISWVFLSNGWHWHYTIDNTLSSIRGFLTLLSLILLMYFSYLNHYKVNIRIIFELSKSFTNFFSKKDKKKPTMWRPCFIVGGSDEHLGIGERELGLHLNVEENPLTSTSIQYARVSFIAYKDLLLQ